MEESIYFKDNGLKPDFFWSAPKRTKTKCSNPQFADHYLHRVAVMKKEHWGAKGDRDEGGVPGWTLKLVCSGCGKEFKKNGFILEKRANNGRK